jgi:hypothetical protein
VVTTEELVSFVKEFTAVDEVQSETDIFSDLRCTGDDFHELIENYAKKYPVDMSSYLWYFHSDEEGQNFGGVFFRPPYERVKRIPVTPQMLADFVNEGRWKINYPSHKLPKLRIDILVNLVLFLVVLFFLIKSCIK